MIDPEATDRPVTTGVQDIHQVMGNADGDRQVSATGDDLPLPEVAALDGEDGERVAAGVHGLQESVVSVIGERSLGGKGVEDGTGDGAAEAAGGGIVRSR